jgi:hypothetical protein
VKLCASRPLTLNPGRPGSRVPEASQPAYLTCGTSCTTIQYKSLTRKHIEAEGYDIFADMGDQFSDLKGGFADRTVKPPNPCTTSPNGRSPITVPATAGTVMANSGFS